MLISSFLFAQPRDKCVVYAINSIAFNENTLSHILRNSHWIQTQLKVCFFLVKLKIHRKRPIFLSIQIWNSKKKCLSTSSWNIKRFPFFTQTESFFQYKRSYIHKTDFSACRRNIFWAFSTKISFFGCSRSPGQNGLFDHCLINFKFQHSNWMCGSFFVWLKYFPFAQCIRKSNNNNSKPFFYHRVQIFIQI